jgi:hypothetical protein
MDGHDVHPSRGTAGTARGVGTDRSNELLDTGARALELINREHYDANHK